jgi:hypothetical protein
MRRVGGWIMRKAVFVKKLRAVDMVDASAKPSDALPIGRVARRVEQKQHQGAAYSGVGLRGVVIRAPFKTGRRVREGRLAHGCAASGSGGVRSAYFPPHACRGWRAAGWPDLVVGVRCGIRPALLYG